MEFLIFYLRDSYCRSKMVKIISTLFKICICDIEESWNNLSNQLSIIINVLGSGFYILYEKNQWNPSENLYICDIEESWKNNNCWLMYTQKTISMSIFALISYKIWKYITIQREMGQWAVYYTRRLASQFWK